MMKPRAHVIHSSHGRTRISIPSKKRNIPYFAQLEGMMSELPMVESVKGNPLVGSLLITHKPSERHSVLQKGSELGLFDIIEMMGDEHIHIAPEITPDEQTKKIYKASFQTLLALAAFQAARGNYLAPASSLLLDAVNLLPRMKSAQRKKN